MVGVILTSDKMVDLGQSDVVMVDVTVFEQAPELQAGQQKDVMWGVDMAKSAVEPVHRPQLCAMHQHHKLHLLQMSHSIRAGPGLKIRTWGNKILQFEAAPDLFTLSVPLSLRDNIQQTFNVHSHVWYRDK